MKLPAPDTFKPRPGETLWIVAAFVFSAFCGSLLEVPARLFLLLPIWPAAGLGLALVLLRGPRVWLGLLLGSFIAYAAGIAWILRDRYPPSFIGWIALVLGMLATAQFLLAGWAIVKATGTRFPFLTFRNALIFISLGPGISNAIVAALGAWFLHASQIQPHFGLFATWSALGIGRAVGSLVFTPLIMGWRFRLRHAWNLKETLSLAVFATVLVLLSYFAFINVRGSPFSMYVMPYFLIPLVIYAASQWELAGVMGTITAVLVVSTLGAQFGRGPFGNGHFVLSSGIELQIFIVMISVGALTGMAVYYQWKIAESRLRKARDELEIKVNQRTEALSAERNFLRQVIEQMPAGVLIASAPDGKPILTNSELYRFSHEEQLDLLSPEGYASHELFTLDRKRIPLEAYPMFRSLWKGEMIREMELIFRKKDGSERIVRVDSAPVRNGEGKIVAAVLTSTDVTERRMAERRLAESEERFRALAETIPQLVWEVDHQGEFEYVNNRWIEFTGLTLEESRENGWRRTIHPDDLERCLRSWNEAIRRKTVFESDCRVRKNDGQYRWMIARGIPLMDEKGQTLHWFGTSTDIEYQKQQDFEKARLLEVERRARAEAENVNRAKDLFLATLSHELRTPLSSILAWSQLLQSGMLPEEKRRIGFEIIEKSARAQSQLIEDMLDMSRIIMGKLKIEPALIQVGSVIENAVKLVRSQAEAKPLHLEVHLKPDTGWVYADRIRLQQVLINLLTNSIKFTPPGGRVKVTSERKGDRILIQVSDTGKGIEKDFLPHVFGRFTQSESSTGGKLGGLGLGLAIVKQLVEMQGGQVRAESEGRGKGATFTVEFPAAEVTVKGAPQKGQAA